MIVLFINFKNKIENKHFLKFIKKMTMNNTTLYDNICLIQELDKYNITQYITNFKNDYLPGFMLMITHMFNQIIISEMFLPCCYLTLALIIVACLLEIETLGIRLENSEQDMAFWRNKATGWKNSVSTLSTKVKDLLEKNKFLQSQRNEYMNSLHKEVLELSNEIKNLKTKFQTDSLKEQRDREILADDFVKIIELLYSKNEEDRCIEQILKIANKFAIHIDIEKDRRIQPKRIAKTLALNKMTIG